MSYDTFQPERDLLERAGKVLEGDPSIEELRSCLQGVVDGYHKTVKQSERVLHMSDRSELRFVQNASTCSDELTLAKAKLERLVSLGVAMAAERNQTKLLETILDGAKNLANADAGTLYLRTADDLLKFEIIKTDSLGFYMGGTEGAPISIPPVRMYQEDTGAPNHSNVVSYTCLSGKTVKIDDAYDPKLTDEQGFDFTGTRMFDKANGYKSSSFLTVPLVSRQGQVIGALQLINALNTDKEAVPFDPEIVSFVEALGAQAGVALENQQLMLSQRELMDSFIELIAGAIDAKSPYTGGHCARVPELASMLCEVASETESGTFADFELSTEEEWREFRIAAWLHDCGKVTTPEYVVDKATKLETIYNRVHEVRTRFEVLRRDAHIKMLEDKLAGHDPVVAEKTYEEKIQQLEDDFAFLAECNVGGEFMSDDRVERLEEIAKITWTRHFSERLGLSPQEELVLKDHPPEVLPATEQLLQDKACHIVPRPDGFEEFMAANKFDIPIPDALYNYGELYNLKIGRGTLTAEERFKINEHIIQTILMLERLPFPKHMSRIPEYAGAHHETMIGTGYPRKLTKEDMSVPARIMAIADVFEALTAADRPYKKAKKLSEALKIMMFMVKDQHLDGDLFKLFLTSGLHEKYAEMFLHADQIDEVDINNYL